MLKESNPWLNVNKMNPSQKIDFILYFKIKIKKLGKQKQLWTCLNNTFKVEKKHSFQLIFVQYFSCMCKNFYYSLSSGKAASDGGNGRSYSDDSSEEAMRVTRSIMIIKPPGFQNGSPPVSPAGSTPPVSPFSGGKESFRFRRRSTSDAYEKGNGVGPRSPRPPYDVWDLILEIWLSGCTSTLASSFFFHVSIPPPMIMYVRRSYIKIWICVRVCVVFACGLCMWLS